MTDADRLTLEQVNGLDEAEFAARLANIYEHAPWAAQAAAASRPFATVTALFDAMKAAVRQVPENERLALVRGHPDLAGKAARAGALTQDSTMEQGSAGLDRLSEAEYERFHRLNQAYRDKFAIPFIICVRRHTKDSIIASFESRIAHTPEAELTTALDEIDRIAALRLDLLVEGPGALVLNGRISTHVLDTRAGKPAVGVAVTLHELSESGPPRLVARAVTNADGRTDAPLIAGRPVPRGRYEIAFDVASYFARAGAASADLPFLDIVPIRFGVAEPEGHYHVPLLVTPWSYVTYRGS